LVGSGCLPFPDVLALIGPSDISPSSAAASVVPCCTAHLGWALLLCQPSVHPRPSACRRFLRRLPGSLCLPEEGRDSPRFLGHPLVACRGPRPRRARRFLALVLRRRRCCLQETRVLGRSETNSFVAVLTRPTSSRAYASSLDIAAHGARLATGLPGSALAGRVSHPLDDFSKFPESPHDSFLYDQPCLVAPCCRVARGSFPPRAPTGAGQGDFHHPALPPRRLT